jgi:hypothetical protein
MVAAICGATALTCSQDTSFTGTRDGPFTRGGLGSRLGFTVGARRARVGLGAFGKSAATMSPGRGVSGSRWAARCERHLLIKAKRRRTVVLAVGPRSPRLVVSQSR